MYNEKIDTMGMFGIVLIIAGVIVLTFFSKTVAA
jgi:multidrug transporter EmrE-like cation transporter